MTAVKVFAENELQRRVGWGDASTLAWQEHPRTKPPIRRSQFRTVDKGGLYDTRNRPTCGASWVR